MNYCLIYAFNKKKERYPTDEEITQMAQKVSKFIDKCKDCPKRLEQNCEKQCIYNT